MPWEWVGPSATATVAIAGFVYGAWKDGRGQAHSELLLQRQQQYELDRQQAKERSDSLQRLKEQQREDRIRWIQERKSLYVDVLTTATELHQVVLKLKISYEMNAPEDRQPNTDRLAILWSSLETQVNACRLLAAGEAGENAAWAARDLLLLAGQAKVATIDLISDQERAEQLDSILSKLDEAERQLVAHAQEDLGTPSAQSTIQDQIDVAEAESRHS